ncbi:protein LEO1 homolog [Lolium rigidum]|uniref:protein LEO1 homolog n=1 Tax=Lolium rigidum TaxID=89674 RepID=UPI001F5E1B3C|nr:protein LEO1 homolog [Lolium rigidum]
MYNGGSMLWSPQPSTYTKQNEASAVEHMPPVEATTCENEAPGFKYNSHGRVAHAGFNAKVHEYSDSEREELEYETEIEDLESSPTYGRENELDENNGYDQDLEEDFGFTSMSDEGIEEQEPKREPRKHRRKVIDSDDESPPPRKQPLKRGKAVVFDSNE